MTESTSNQEPLNPEYHCYYDPANSSQTNQQTDCVPSSHLSSHDGQYLTELSSFEGSSYLSNDQQIASQCFVSSPDHAILPGTASARSNLTGPSGYHFGAIPEPYMGPFLNPTETQTLRSGHITSEWGTHRTDGTNIFPGPGPWPPGPQLFINSTNSGANHSLISPNPSTSYMYSLADASEHGPEQALGPLSSDVSLPPHNRGNIPGGYSVAINHQRLARHHTTNFEIKWFCTVCGDKPFKDKDTWRRHERCHYPDIEYVCSPSGPVLFTPDGERCAFCNAEYPDLGHLAGHKAQSCYEKKEKWARKDTFVRHLRAQHGVPDASRRAEMWSNKPPARVLGCGFCVMSFNNTTSRSSHIAQHMEDGYTTADWDRCNVVRSLLSQPRVALDWQAVLREYVGEQHPLTITWSNEIASGLQKRLEDGEESGQELALAAIYQSSLYVVENPSTTSRDEPGNGSGSYHHDISTMNQFLMVGAQVHGYNYFAESAGDYDLS